MKTHPPKNLQSTSSIDSLNTCHRLPLVVAAVLSALGGIANASPVTYTETTTTSPVNWSSATWTGGTIANINAGDVAQFVSTSANMNNMVLDANVTVGQLLKSGNKNWTLGTPSGAYSFTLDNSGGDVNPFGGSLAFVGANGTGGTLLVTPGIVIGSSSGLLIGSTGAGATGNVTISGGITGTGDLYVASGASSSSAITINTVAINNSGNLIIGKSDSSSNTTGTGAITISGGIGSNVENISNYSAGAVTLSTTAISSTGTITNAAVGSGTMTISSIIGGASGVTQNSSTSLLLLSANNTYTGLTTISSGTLQIGSGGNSGSIVGSIVDNGTLVINRTGTWVYNGGISGSGSVNKLGSATVTIAGNNSYNGGTTVNAGTLILTGSNTGAGGFSVVAGGTMQIGNGGMTGSIGGAGGIAGNITDNGTVVFKRADDITYGNIISGAGGLTVNGGNAVTFTGANTYSGTTAITSSRIHLDFSDAAAPASNILGSSSSLVLSSGIVDITGKDGVANTQRFNAVTTGTTNGTSSPSGGGGHLNVTAGTGGTLNVDMGALTLGAGVPLAINLGSGATVTTTTVPLDSGTTGWTTSYGGDLVINNGTGWNFAKSSINGNGTYTLAGLTSADYAALPSTGGTLLSKGGNAYLGGLGSLTGAVNVYTLKIDTAGFGSSQALDLGGQTLSFGATGSLSAGSLVGGLLVVGDQDYEIKNGSIRGNSTSPRYIVINQYSTGTLTISGIISNGVGATGLVKAGPGTLLLTATNNTYDLNTYIQEGTLAIDNGRSLGTSKPVDIYAGATLEARGTFALTGTDGVTVRNIGIGAGANISVTDGNNLTVGGVISNVYTDVLGSLNKTGAGTLTLTGVNTHTGSTTVSAGELDVNGTQAAGSSISVANGATLGGSGTVNGDVAVRGGAIKGGGLNVSGAANFKGTSALSGLTTISGGITASTGILSVTGTTNSNMAVSDGATLANNGKVIGNVQVSGILSGSGLINGNLTLQDIGHISLQLSGTALGMHDEITVTGANSLITLNNSILDLMLSPALSGDYVFTLIDNQGGGVIGGGFSSVVLNGNTFVLSGSNSFSDGNYSYDLSYTGGDGNDVILMVATVPEPGTWAMLLGGLGTLVMFRRSIRRLA